MKKLILSIAIAVIGGIVTAQETTVNLSMGVGYETEVYYKLSTETETTFSAASWDIAFLRNDNLNHGIRINDGIGIEVFEASNNPSDWNSIDVANEASWTQLYNSDTQWNIGAFMQGSATYGWGEYNPVTHHIEGSVIFVLKYADGIYRKFINEDYFGEYTFKYATWDGTNWSSDTTETVSNSGNPDNRYNYYSLQNNQEVVSEPAEADWDFVFRKYTTFLDPPGQYYAVTGTLHNSNVTVAQNEETGAPDPNELAYLEEMNTIGFDWKAFTGVWTVDNDQKYYVKYDENTVYRLYFTDFEGSSNGNLTFVFEEVSDLLGFEDVSEEVSFGIFPNPSKDKIIQLIYDINTASSEENYIDIYDLNGRKVFYSNASNTEGFYSKRLNLSSLQSGMYVLTFTSGSKTISKKLILN